jgi:hypothetical protein
MPFLDKRSSLKGPKLNFYSYPPEKQPDNAKSTNVPPTDNEAPPSYTMADPNTQGPPGPSVDELNAAFSSLNLGANTALPTADQCLAHLKLLSAFHTLKEDTGYTDGLFNLWDAKCEMVSNRDEMLAKMREKRWSLYIARAVERFEAWWLQVLCRMEPSQRLESKQMVASRKEFVQFTKLGNLQIWNQDMLPPLGKILPHRERGFIDKDRRSDGLACIHVEPPKLSRGLCPLWSTESLGNWHAMGCGQRCY